MAITYITGDLLQHAKTGIIAHIVNDQGGWGKGFSGMLSKAYPRAEPSYRKWFKSGYFYCGLTHLEELADNLLVAHMAAQVGYKSTDNPKPLNYDYLRDCLSSLTRTNAATKKLPIHMPRIGSGLGGGNWDDIEAIINEEAPDLDIRVYTLEGKVPMPTAAPVVPQEAKKVPLVRQKPFCIIESPVKGRKEYWDLEAAYTAIRRAKNAGFYVMVAASGSRERDSQEDYEAFATRVQRVCKFHDEDLQHIAIVQGGARGFDNVARQFAYIHKLPLITFPADWEGPDQRGAGMIRNQYIIDVADELIAAPGDGTGTQDCITKARLAKVPVMQC